MFPLNDLNFIACAIATVSAAVGYKVSRARTRGANGFNGLAEYGRAVGQSRFNFLKLRRRNSTASFVPTECDGTEPPTSECGTPLPPAGQDDILDQPQEGSVKRRRSATPDSEATYVTPKRRKTSVPEEYCENPVKIEEIVPQSIDDPLPDGSETSMDAEHDQGILAGAPGSASETKTSNRLATETSCQSGVPSSASPLESFVPLTNTSPLAALPAPAWPRTPVTIVAVKPSSAFQAFSGTTSAFGSVSTEFTNKGPAWSAPSSEAQIASGASASDPLAAQSYSTTTHTNITGEEDEEVVTELKGAKVFIKRGERDFCEGILGNVKLLKHKETGHERILFRREPVMKVSMNVPLRPLVRCSFDEVQGQLRIALMERVEDAAQQERVAVYALKVRRSTHRSQNCSQVLTSVFRADRGARHRGPSSRTLRRRSWRARVLCASSSQRLLQPLHECRPPPSSQALVATGLLDSSNLFTLVSLFSFMLSV
ncbi:hypothetical protein BC628DRAFT_1350403 [Trametes gibbosa]|nr:hypothetical protein BC628DRAFT_1350403 [Trametes gibbosa]